MDQNDAKMIEKMQPIGYAALIELLGLQVIPPWRMSYTAPLRKKQVRKEEYSETHFYPLSYCRGEGVLFHLEFALKHEGIELAVIKGAMESLTDYEVTGYIKSRPTSRYARLIWFFYENFNACSLPVPDCNQGKYVTVLDEKLYFCGPSRKSPRHRVANNLLGDWEYCPQVRRTALIGEFEEKDFSQAVFNLAGRYEPALLSRAIRYLYTKETLSSWEIERETPDPKHLSGFCSLLESVGKLGDLNEELLVALQKQIVDPRFALDHYRTFQNYVGEEPAFGSLLIHYIAPKPEDLNSLMAALLRAFKVMFQAAVHPVISAAIVSFGFVLLHPFWDGNGRLHRLLIHYALAKTAFVPAELVFPISAVIVREHARYDKTLELFSRPLTKLVEYQVDRNGEMTVLSESGPLYRYLDFTPFVEFLFHCIEVAITTDFRVELAFLASYDRIKNQLLEVVAMPLQQLDLFIRCVRQNEGHLSSRKREKFFAKLTDDEIAKMEEIINQGF